MEKKKFIIDTLCWKKLEILNNIYINLDQLYDSLNLCTTHEIVKEVEQYGYSSLNPIKLTILPTKKNEIYNSAITLNFDEADSSLLSNLGVGVYGITEDKPLLAYGKGFNFNIMQLIDFLIILVSIDLVSKTNLHNIVKKLREMSNISKKKEAQVKTWLQNH